MFLSEKNNFLNTLHFPIGCCFEKVLVLPNKIWYLLVFSYEFLIQRHQRPIDEIQRLKFKDIVKRLEEGLFKTALTKVSTPSPPPNKFLYF